MGESPVPPAPPCLSMAMQPSTTRSRSWPTDYPPAHNVRVRPPGPLQRRGVARNQYGGPGQVERLDTYHGLDWDGPGPVPRVYGLKAAKLLPKRGIFRKGCILPTTMRAQAPGPMPKENVNALL